MNTDKNIKFGEFKKVLKDIDTMLNIDVSEFEDFYKSRGFSQYGYLENFVDELNESFLSNVNKDDTLKYYLFELNFWNREFIINNNELIFKKQFEAAPLSLEEKPIIEAYDLFDIVMAEIILCCLKYNLDFYKLCDEINFDYSFTDTGLIGVFGDKNFKNQKETDQGNKLKKRLGDKWYALQYFFELIAHGNPIPYDSEGGFNKSDLELTGQERCGSKGQGFYRAFMDIDINNSERIKREYSKDWIEKILELSKNDEVTIDYITKKYKPSII